MGTRVVGAGSREGKEEKWKESPYMWEGDFVGGRKLMMVVMGPQRSQVQFASAP